MDVTALVFPFRWEQGEIQAEEWKPQELSMLDQGKEFGTTVWETTHSEKAKEAEKVEEVPTTVLPGADDVQPVDPSRPDPVEGVDAPVSVVVSGQEILSVTSPEAKAVFGGQAGQECREEVGQPKGWTEEKHGEWPQAVGSDGEWPQGQEASPWPEQEGSQWPERQGEIPSTPGEKPFEPGEWAGENGWSENSQQREWSEQEVGWIKNEGVMGASPMQWEAAPDGHWPVGSPGVPGAQWSEASLAGDKWGVPAEPQGNDGDDVMVGPLPKCEAPIQPLSSDPPLSHSDFAMIHDKDPVRFAEKRAQLAEIARVKVAMQDREAAQKAGGSPAVAKPVPAMVRHKAGSQRPAHEALPGMFNPQEVAKSVASSFFAAAAQAAAKSADVTAVIRKKMKPKRKDTSRERQRERSLNRPVKVMSTVVGDVLTYSKIRTSQPPMF